MKFFPLCLILSVSVAGLSIAQEVLPTKPAESKPKFSLPFKIPGLSGGNEEASPAAAIDSPVLAENADGGDSAAPSIEGEGSTAPGQEGLPPGVQPDSGDNIDFVQRSNFIISKIRNNFRQLDPFGMPMDPTNPAESPALATQYEEIEEAPVLTNSSLKSALKTLPISGIYPNKSMIVIGARSFSRGDQFGMKFEELTIRLRFEGLRGHQIYFKDLDTQEVASVDFSPTPKEFEPITSNSSAPKSDGIVPMDSLFIVN